MARGKLILICQAGGEFKINDDGTLSYSGGEAHAVDINEETTFDKLKSTLAEMCNFAVETVTMKYFLPGNKQIRISLSNDKDLKRMYDFHSESVTAEVFVDGKEGFIRVSEPEPVTETPPAIEPTPTVTESRTAVKITPKKPFAAKTTRTAVKITPKKPFAAKTTKRRSITIVDDLDDDNLVPVTVTLATDDEIITDMTATPADAVKKRRRRAKRKIGDGLTADVDIEEDEEIRGSSSRKKIARKNSSDDEEFEGTPLLDYSSNHPLEEIVASWKDGITGVGHEFKSVHEFRDALQKYAIANRFSYKMKKNDSTRVSGICVVEGCSWKIHASWVPSDQVFRVKKLNESHTCGGESWKSPHVTKNWLVSTIKEKLRDSTSNKPKHIHKRIFDEFGLDLKYAQIRRGVEDAREQLQGSYKDSYNQLPRFCDKLVESNPGSSVNLDIGEEKKFRRLFVSFSALINGFQTGCRPLLFLDATSFKSRFHEVLLTASALDGNDGIFPVAFALVDVENDDNWRWFLEQLRSAVSNSRPITFVSDREKELMKSVLEVFENAHHGYSVYSLMESFMTDLEGPFCGDGRGSLPISFMAAAHAPTLDRFRMFTEQIKSVSTHAYDWLMQVDPEYWSNALFKGERYNQITFDVGEVYANWVEEVRDKPIIFKLEKLISNIMELMNDRRVEVNQWSSKLTPLKEAKLTEEKLKAHGLKVLFSSDTLFEVHDTFSNVVDIDKKDCSCLEWKSTGLPCCHAIAVFDCTKRDVHHYIPKYFTVDSYRKTYFDIICPVTGFKPLEKDDAVPESDQVFPPSTPRPPSLHKKKQTTTLGVSKRTVCCRRCKGEGHNKSTCKEPL